MKSHRLHTKHGHSSRIAPFPEKKKNRKNKTTSLWRSCAEIHIVYWKSAVVLHWADIICIPSKTEKGAKRGEKKVLRMLKALKCQPVSSFDLHWMQILARGHVSPHACVDMLNVIYTFSLFLIEEASDIVLVCDCLFCGVLQLFFFCENSFVLANVMHCKRVGSLSPHWSGTNVPFMIILCAICRMTVIYHEVCFVFFSRRPPRFSVFLSLSLPVNLPGLSTSMRFRNVNDQPEGQTEKVTHFPAMLNMQIPRQIIRSRSRQAHN